MIVRTWRGRASIDRPDAYLEHFNKSVEPELRAVPGFAGAKVLRQARPDGFDFLVVTMWTSMDAIKAFAGEHYERAVVEPGAVAALESFDDTVEHFDLVKSVSA